MHGACQTPCPGPDEETAFQQYSRYYDLLYRDKDYAAEADYVARLIHRFCPEAASILEFGSGTGIHASLLAEKGYKLHGIELSSEMLARSSTIIGSSNNASGRLVFSQGDIRKVRLNEYFDAVIALFHVMSYQTSNEDVLAAFHTAREHLHRDGVFFFDLWYGPAVLVESPTVRIKRMTDEYLEVTRIAEPVLHPNEDRVDVNYHVFARDLQSGTVKELRVIHKMRYFFKPEIELFAAQSGFCILHAEEWLTGNAVGLNSWGACFCLKAM